MKLKFRIKKRRGEFFLLIGTPEDEGRDYFDIRKSYFAEMLPRLKESFLMQDEAIAAMNQLRQILSGHPIYGRI